MEKHTKEPWKVENQEKGQFIGIVSAGHSWQRIATMNSIHPPDIADAKRIVTCVNALKGISNKNLEDGIIEDLVEFLRQAKVVIPEYNKCSILLKGKAGMLLSILEREA